MLLAALAVGLLTAYYFGLRPGMMAAGATAALFLIAFVAPGLALYAYGAVAVGVFGLLWAGPRMRPKGGAATTSALALLARARRLMQTRRARRR